MCQYERGENMNKITHCMSILEPWTSKIVARQKSIEWRSRKLIARPPETIAIATSKRGAGDTLPGGHIVGVARISSIVPWRNTRDFFERAGDVRDYYNRERWQGYAMMIGGFAACEPVPVRGQVGIYRAPDGFAPRYAESPEQLREWWSAAGARAWQDGPKNEVERELMELMAHNGIGWRIDD